MNGKDTPVRSSLHLLLWLIGRAGAQGVFSILAARSLGAADFGAFAAALSLAGGIVPWLGLGLTTVMVQRIAMGADSPQRELHACLRWYLLSYPLLTALGLVLVQVLLPAVRVPASLVIIAEMTAGFVEPVMRLAHGTRRFHRMGSLSLGLSASRLLAVGLAWVTSQQSLDRFCWFYLLCCAAYTAALLAGPLGTMVRAASTPGGASLRATEGLPFSVLNSTYRLNSEFNKTALVWCGQNSDAGNFNAAYRLTDLISLPVFSAMEAAVPGLFASAAGGRRQMVVTMLGTVRILLPLALLSGVALYLAAPAALWLYGDRYPEVPLMLRHLCLLPVLFAIWMFARTAAIVAGRKVWCMTVECATATLSIVALLLLVPRGGWQAAVAITYVSYLFMAVLHAAGLFRGAAVSGP